MQIWGSRKEIAKLVAELGLTAEVQTATERAPGKRGPGRPIRQPYKYARITGYLLTHAGSRMECVNFGCRKQLRVNPKSICCSEACEREFRAYVELILGVLDGNILPESLPVWARSKRPSVRTRLREQAATAESLSPVPPEPISKKSSKKRGKNGCKARRPSKRSDGRAGHQIMRYLP